MQALEQTLDSREVAKMVEKDHKYLMRDIRNYSADMTSAKISPVDFFKESTYIDAKGETRPCYRITKKGCEFIAHKLTGTKGTIFTARYINRFHEMESILSEQKREVAPVQLDQILQITQEHMELRREINDLKADMLRINRIQMSYGSSRTYKGVIIGMLEGIKEEENETFLRQIYTIIKIYMKRKCQHICMTHNIS